MVRKQRHLDVLDDAHRGIALRHLERPSDAEPPDPPRRQQGDVIGAEKNPSGVGADLAVEDVETGRLAGPVRTNQGEEFARSQVETDIDHGGDAAK